MSSPPGDPSDAQGRWDRAYAGVDDDVIPEASAFVQSWGRLIAGRSCELNGVDVAGGSGRHALWFAARGVNMTVIDVSPVGLAQAQRWAERQGAELDTLVWDLEVDDGVSFPDGSWDVIVKTYFLNRDLLRALPARLNPGGVLLFAQPTVANLERNERPSRRFLLESGEVHELAQAMVAADAELHIEHVSEAWEPNNTHEAQLVVRRSG